MVFRIGLNERKKTTAEVLEVRVECCKSQQDLCYASDLIEQEFKSGNLYAFDYMYLKRQLKEKSDEILGIKYFETKGE